MHSASSSTRRRQTNKRRQLQKTNKKNNNSNNKKDTSCPSCSLNTSSSSSSSSIATVAESSSSTTCTCINSNININNNSNNNGNARTNSPNGALKIIHAPSTVKREKRSPQELQCTVCGRYECDQITFTQVRRMSATDIDSYRSSVNNCRTTVSVGGYICDRCFRTHKIWTEHQLQQTLALHPQTKYKNMISCNKPASYWVKNHPKVYRHVDRIDYCNVTNEIVDEYMFVKKEPLVVTNTVEALAKYMLSNDEGNVDQMKDHLLKLFTLDYLKSDDVADVYHRPRDNDTFKDMDESSLADYIRYLEIPKEQRDPPNLYGKDIPCPDKWKQFMFSNDGLYPRFQYKGNRDLLAELPEQIRAISLMVYIGDHGSFTPAHQDLCGTLGHNLMVYADRGEPTPIEQFLSRDPDTQQAIDTEKENRRIYQDDVIIPSDEAYALWCVFKPNELGAVKSFWKKNGGFMEDDNFFIPLETLATSNLSTILIEQRVGDMVLLPPLAPHQVVNEQGRSAKIAWNTLAHQSIEDSYHCLADYRTNGKSQIYRIKAVSYFALKNRTEAIIQGHPMYPDTLAELLSLLKIVCDMYFDDWIESNMFNPSKDAPVTVDDEEEGNHTRTCNHCNCDIWNRWYHCDLCKNEANNYEGYDYCLECYKDMRGCIHWENLVLSEHISMGEIKKTIDRGKQAYLILRQKHMEENGDSSSSSTFSLEDLDKLLHNDKHDTKRSIASIAFELQQRAKLQKDETYYCHQCKKRHKLAETLKCSKCDLYYCGHCLWNNYTIHMADKLMLKTGFICPKCEHVCNCDHCLQDRGIDPVVYHEMISKQVSEVKEIEPFAERTLIEKQDDQKFGIADMRPLLLTKRPLKRKIEQIKIEQSDDQSPKIKKAKLSSPNKTVSKKSLASLTSTIKQEKRGENRTIQLKREINSSIGVDKPASSNAPIQSPLPTPDPNSTLSTGNFNCSSCSKPIVGCVRQHSDNRQAFYCRKCAKKLAVPCNMYAHTCDKCHKPIVGTRYSAMEKDFCDPCFFTHNPKQLLDVDVDDCEFQIHVPQFAKTRLSLIVGEDTTTTPITSSPITTITTITTASIVNVDQDKQEIVSDNNKDSICKTSSSTDSPSNHAKLNDGAIATTASHASGSDSGSDTTIVSDKPLKDGMELDTNQDEQQHSST